MTTIETTQFEAPSFTEPPRAVPGAYRKARTATEDMAQRLTDGHELPLALLRLAGMPVLSAQQRLDAYRGGFNGS